MSQVQVKFVDEDFQSGRVHSQTHFYGFFYGGVVTFAGSNPNPSGTWRLFLQVFVSHRSCVVRGWMQILSCVFARVKVDRQMKVVCFKWIRQNESPLVHSQ